MQTQITSQSFGINYNTFLNQTDIKKLSLTSVYPIYSDFGNFNNDVLELSLFDKANNSVVWKTIYPSTKSSSTSVRYVNENNVETKFDIDISNNNYLISKLDNGTRRIVVPALYDIINSGISFGEYNVQYLPAKNVIGDENTRISISEISPSGNEISLTCKDTSIYDKFESFCKNKLPSSEWMSYFLTGTNSVNLYRDFTTEKDKFGEYINNIKYFFGFKTDDDIIFFLYDIYNGVFSGKQKSNGNVSASDIISIKKQIENYCYSLYNTSTNLDDAHKKCISIVENIVTDELKKISKTATTSRNISFFVNIFISTISSIFTDVKNKCGSKLFFPLKTCLNFGNGDIVPVLNTYYTESDTGVIKLFLKLKDSIKNRKVIGDMVYITNFNTLSGIYQKISITNKSNVVLKKLAGPNFNEQIKNVQLGNSGKLYNSEDLTTIVEGIEPTNRIDKINVDYRYFENFVKFSNVSARLSIYSDKVKAISDIESNIRILDSINTPSSDIDKIALVDTKKSIYNSFDGYEYFLNLNPEWYDIHTGTVGDYSVLSDYQQTSCSLYDLSNTESLLFNTPENIRSDESNYDYVNFVNMVGHMLDNIWIYIDNFPKTKIIKNNMYGSISPSFIGDIIESFGWECGNGNYDLDLLRGLYNDISGNTKQLLSGNDRTKEIWARLLNTLPEILKTKGTSKSIDLVLSCYGIPKNIIKVKETSIYNIDNEVYYNDIIKFSPKITNYNEFIECDWLDGCKSLEMSIRYQSSTYAKSSIHRLAQCGYKWSVGSIKRSKDNGDIFFTIQDISNNIKTITVENIPIFNGDVYDILIRKYDSEDVYNSPAIIPVKFELIVLKVENGKKSFIASSFQYLGKSYEDSFSSGNDTIRFGNYNAESNNYFVGNIDEIKIWNTFISDSEFLSHGTMYDNFSNEDIQKTIDNLVCRISFDKPVDLYVPSGSIYYHKNNGLQNNGIEEVKLYNFRESEILSKMDIDCVSTTSYKYPYQFDRYEITQEILSNNLYTSDLSSRNIRSENRIKNADLNPTFGVESTENKNISKNKIGVYFSPSDQYTIDKIKFTSLVNIDNLIGIPERTNSYGYAKLEEFKRKYISYLTYGVDKNRYINNVKNVIDKSLFGQIKKVVPENSNVITGILIEQTPFERIKLEPPVPQISAIPQLANNNSIKPHINSSVSNDQTGDITPSIKGKLADKNYFENSYLDIIEKNSIPYGETNTFADLGGYFMLDGDDYYIDVIDYYLTQIRDIRIGSEQSIAKIKRNKLSYIKFPVIDQLNFTGSLNGNFSGSYEQLSSNLYNIYGEFTGNILSEDTQNYSNVHNTIIISGSYVGISPINSTLSSSLNGFSGKLITVDNTDIYKWSTLNLNGELLNQISKNEKKDKYSSIFKQYPLLSKTKSIESISVIKKYPKKDMEYNKQTNNTTIALDGGLLDGSLPFYSIKVDSGRTKVFNQSSGNILGRA